MACILIRSIGLKIEWGLTDNRPFFEVGYPVFEITDGTTALAWTMYEEWRFLFFFTMKNEDTIILNDV